MLSCQFFFYLLLLSSWPSRMFCKASQVFWHVQFLCMLCQSASSDGSLHFVWCLVFHPSSATWSEYRTCWMFWKYFIFKMYILLVLLSWSCMERSIYIYISLLFKTWCCCFSTLVLLLQVWRKCVCTVLEWTSGFEHSEHVQCKLNVDMMKRMEYLWGAVVC